MPARLHLISAPFAPIRYPSPALGALKAYVDRELGANVESFSYSAFLEIFYELRQADAFEFYERFYEISEQLFQLLYFRNYRQDDLRLSTAELQTYLDALNREKVKGEPLTFELLDQLERAVFHYVDSTILPNLSSDSSNVIGFSMCFSQVYASLFLARRIEQQAGGRKLVFLYGGFSAMLPNIVELLARLEAPGYIVFGEGEEKLTLILKNLISQGPGATRLSAPITGVFEPQRPINLYERDLSLFENEIQELATLPLPDFDEYFALYARLMKRDPFFRIFGLPGLTLEASRGCFAKCNFCSFNQQYAGFRRQPARLVFKRTLALLQRYEAGWLFFVDAVSDTYAETFADEVLAAGVDLKFFLELRVHHPELFWIKLAAAGAKTIQIGVEAISAPMLKGMAKGTKVIQNLRALKYLKELGIETWAGLITHHPLQTRADILETLRVLEQTTHLDPLLPHMFGLGAGSPLYNKLRPEVKRALKPLRIAGMPDSLARYIAVGYYELPAEYAIEPEDAAGWKEVFDFASRRLEAGFGQCARFTAVKDRTGSIKITDERFGTRQFILKGLAARIFDACHQGLRLDDLERLLAADLVAVRAELEKLIAQKLVLFADGHYLSLGLRPAAELLEKLDVPAHRTCRTPPGQRVLSPISAS